MDFIEQLPPSLGFTTILVIIDRLSKQGVFIPTVDTITSAQLAELFVLHIFSKHGVPSYCTSDCGSEFVSHFSCSLGFLQLRNCAQYVAPFHLWLPSTSGRSDGKGKPNVGTVLTNLLQFPTG
jgi:hypothetical protein